MREKEQRGFLYNGLQDPKDSLVKITAEVGTNHKASKCQEQD